MDKFLVTRKCENTFTRPIMVTTSPRVTCPRVCAFRKGGDGPLAGLCYAEHGALGGFLWTLLDRTPIGRTMINGVRAYGFDDLLYIVRSLEPGALWRHNIAGDLTSNNQTTIDRAALRALVDASLAHADQLADLHIAPVTVILPAESQQNTKTPKGRTVVICSNTTHGVTCAECGLCSRSSRSTIVGFPASGGLKHHVKKEPAT